MSAVVAVLLLLAPAQLVEPLPLAMPGQATEVAVRLDPPTPESATPGGSSDSAGGRCVGWEPLLSYYSPGWDVGRMSRIMYRESRCRPEVRNPSGATGLLQIMPAHCSWLPNCSVRLLQDAAYNIRSAAALWRRQGMDAWAL